MSDERLSNLAILTIEKEHVKNTNFTTVINGQRKSSEEELLKEMSPYRSLRFSVKRSMSHNGSRVVRQYICMQHFIY